MNRRSIRDKKLQIEKLLIPAGKRIVSLEKEYNQLRAQIEPLPGDSEERAELHKKAAEKFKDLQEKNSEFNKMMVEHNHLSEIQKNRNTSKHGQKVRDDKVDARDNNIQST